MERRWQLDSAGYPHRGRTIRSLILAFTLVSSALLCLGQASRQDSVSDLLSKVKLLFEQSRWQEVVEACEAQTASDPDLDYYYGSALAQLGRWDDADRVFLRGYRLAPRDKRFAVELGGVAFKQKRYPDAASWLRRALHADPGDSYANDFLGTVYFLQGNLDAALKYWNRVNKPQIDSVRPDHPLQIRPELLDHALTFSPASPLLQPELLTSRARVEGLGVFPRPDFQLAARDDDKFDVILNLQERNGVGDNAWEASLSTFRGIAYQTVYPEYFNLRHSAINVTSLVRFDSQKRRTAADVSGPLNGNPKRRYRVGLDLRNENWAIRDSFTGVAPTLASLNLRREAASAEITSFESGRWDWSAGVELSHRDYRSVDGGTALTPDLLLEGIQLKQFSHLRYEVWRDPDHRFVVNSTASSQFARIWSQAGGAFAKLQGSCSVLWDPKAEGDDYQTEVQVRGGGISGSGPFDELFMLGLERDNDLWMRAHIGTRDGRKGSAPLGDRYFLMNSEVDKRVYGNGFLSVKLSPFLDTGKIAGPAGQLGSPRWLWDTGLQAKFRVLGLGLNFTWGRDLLTGNNAFYFMAVR
jgi:tetratricopeptide (TPR) repeat protein